MQFVGQPSIVTADRDERFPVFSFLDWFSPGDLFLSMQLRHGLARYQEHLQGTLHSLRIIRVNTCGRLRVHLGQLPMHAGPALGRRQRLNFSAYLGICVGHVGQSITQDLEIKHGATHQ